MVCVLASSMTGSRAVIGGAQDAVRRNAGEFVSVVVVGGERVAIRAEWAAFDRPLMVAGVQGGVLPRPVVGHRVLDAKEPLVVIGDDQEERFGN
jgi:hypothetical protein